ncbi:MAG: hypothetical protein IH782_11630, partial [candidate division NC10 bacterium]|nr:hypothetical protein [candidate division NC10 bacterium]
VSRACWGRLQSPPMPSSPLWHSQQATTPWRCCGDDDDNYYRPPIRNWGYDTLFDTNPPPGTPMGIAITRGQWSEG